MSGLALIGCVCLMFLCSPSSSDLTEDEDYSFKMVTKAANAICWYNYLKELPPHDFGPGYHFCLSDTNFTEEAPYWESRAEGYDGMLIFAVTDGLRRHKFEIYGPCSQYIKDSTAFPDREYQQLMEDKKEYKYRNFAHCFLGILENTYGNKAITDLEQLWKDRQTYLMAMLNRGNEFRAFHGVPQLELDDQLTKLAQIRAEELAHGNAFDHSFWRYEYPFGYRIIDCQFRGESCGESVDYVNMDRLEATIVDDEIAMMASNMWYWEEGNFPWQTYYQKNSSYHSKYFTQLVWKGSKFVGYGLAKTYYKSYIVAMYWPAGNPTDDDSIHLYQENVFPPKEALK